VQVRIPAVHRQCPFCTLFDWGPVGAEALADDAEVGVSAVVPVLRDGVFVDAVLG
jgi:hypothetical protein